jgi:prevent-host-death family protein
MKSIVSFCYRRKGTMGISVSIAKGRASLFRLLARLEAGEEAVVTRRGRPVARIVPIARSESRLLGASVGRGALSQRMRSQRAFPFRYWSRKGSKKMGGR